MRRGIFPRRLSNKRPRRLLRFGHRTIGREYTMREINAKDITEQVKRLCMEANSYLPEDIKERINKSE